MRTMAASAAALSRNLRARHRGPKSVRLKKRLNPLKAPLQRAHHAVFIARGQPRLPLVHPARISLFEHGFHYEFNSAVRTAG